MPETITLHALDLSGETTLKLFLRKNDGSLLNTGGDTLTEISSSGVFQATLAESRSGLGDLSYRICDGTETANNLLIDGFLPESETTIGASSTSILSTNSVLSIFNQDVDAAFDANSFGARWLINDGTNGREVKVTGANHIAADIHDCQADGLSASTEIIAINTFASRITTGITQDGQTWQFTSNMLELGPSGGSGDASQDTLLLVKEKTDLIGTVNGITSLLAASVLEPGMITSFPETLRVGDSYTDALGRGIQLPIVDTDGTPLASAGTKNFSEATATFTIKRAGDTESSRIITGSAVFVDPPGTGTGEAPYALVEIPSSETAKGLVKYRYTGLLTFTWPYVGTGTDAEVMTFETGTITFEA